MSDVNNLVTSGTTSKISSLDVSGILFAKMFVKPLHKVITTFLKPLSGQLESSEISLIWDIKRHTSRC
jgi:hypothetical protein